jgi:hypothetical protein
MNDVREKARHAYSKADIIMMLESAAYSATLYLEGIEGALTKATK